MRVPLGDLVKAASPPRGDSGPPGPKRAVARWRLSRLVLNAEAHRLQATDGGGAGVVLGAEVRVVLERERLCGRLGEARVVEDRPFAALGVDLDQITRRQSGK